MHLFSNKLEVSLIFFFENILTSHIINYYDKFYLQLNLFIKYRQVKSPFFLIYIFIILVMKY